MSLGRNELEVIQYLQKLALEKGSFLAKTILAANPESKPLVQVEGITTVPFKNAHFPTKLHFAIKTLIKMLDATHIADTRVRIGREHNEEFTYQGKPINLSTLRSVYSQIYNELERIPTLVDHAYGLLNSKSGGTTYNNQQILLYKVDKDFLAQLLRTVKPSLERVDYSEASKLYNEEVLNYGEKNSPVDGKVIRYPPAYERAVRLLAGLAGKWVAQSSTLTPSAKLEYDKRVERASANFDGAQDDELKLSILQDMFNVLNSGESIDLQELSNTVIQVLLPKTNPPNASYDDVANLFLKYGGDSRMLPDLYDTLDKQDVFDALNIVNKSGLANKRLLTALFILLGIEANLNNDTFSPRKKLPFALEQVLVSVKKNGEYILLQLNQSTNPPPLILSEEAWQGAPKEVKDAYSGLHSSSDYGTVQKVAFSLFSLIGQEKAEDKYELPDVSEAINKISFAAALWKYQTAAEIDAKKPSKAAKKRGVSVVGNQQPVYPVSQPASTPFFTATAGATAGSIPSTPRSRAGSRAVSPSGSSAGSSSKKNQLPASPRRSSPSFEQEI